MATTEFLPLNESLIVDEVTIQRTSEGGIALPDSKGGQYLEGKVIAVSRNLRTRDGTKIEPGMQVVWPKGQEVVLWDGGVKHFRLPITGLHLLRVKDPA